MPCITKRRRRLSPNGWVRVTETLMSHGLSGCIVFLPPVAHRQRVSPTTRHLHMPLPTCSFPLGIALAASVALAACGDTGTNASPFTGPDAPAFSRNESQAARGVFHRYVAIGTSVSMGWASEGVIASSQGMAWPLQLARRAGREMSAPYIGFPGCRSPFRAPLITFERISKESVGIPAPQLGCAPLAPSAQVPAANTAMNAARAADALRTTPENTADLGNKQLYARVLPPNTTQVMAMERQNPKFVSVELGANEVLGGTQGRFVPGENVVPLPFFAADYDVILDRVARTVNSGALLMGLIDDVADFPAFRTGHELWMNSAEFQTFGVLIQPDCEESPNLIFVPTRVPTAIATANQTKQPFLFSCTASTDPTAVDYTLTPAEAAKVNALLAQIDGYIRLQAERRGWAYARLNALYGKPGLKGPFSVGELMTSFQPYGPYMSLDGVHPSAEGQAILADAAATAINARYRLGLPVGFSARIAAR